MKQHFTWPLVFSENQFCSFWICASWKQLRKCFELCLTHCPTVVPNTKIVSTGLAAVALMNNEVNIWETASRTQSRLFEHRLTYIRLIYFRFIAWCWNRFCIQLHAKSQYFVTQSTASALLNCLTHSLLLWSLRVWRQSFKRQKAADVMIAVRFININGAKSLSTGFWSIFNDLNIEF